MAEKEEKKAFVLRVNPGLLRDIEKWASDEFRSVNGQIEYLLHKALRDAGRGSVKKDKDPGQGAV